MSFEGRSPAGSDLYDLGNNLANLVVGLAGTPATLVAGAMGFANRILNGPGRNGCGCGPRIEYQCDGAIVRHHCHCCHVPPDYGCGRGCR
jgi:hypothetical protein